ncbi:hypothetical protein GCM10023339_07630 [Alloalcanivorax gelatiniphagus]
MPKASVPSVRTSASSIIRKRPRSEPRGREEVGGGPGGYETDMRAPSDGNGAARTSRASCLRIRSARFGAGEALLGKLGHHMVHRWSTTGPRLAHG